MLFFENEFLLDTSGLVLQLGNEQITDGYICSPTQLYYGDQTITVTYGSLSSEFNVSVKLLADVNLDGTINIRDVTASQRHAAEIETFTEEQLALADTNGDGKVDINDATYLQRYLAEFDGIVLGQQPLS